VHQLCVHCGSARLIRLSFTDPEPDDGGHLDASGHTERADVPERPTMKCLACGQRLYAADINSRSDSNGNATPVRATQNSVVIIERLRSIGRSSQPPTLGDLRMALGNISELPDDAELSLESSGVLDSRVLINWDAGAPRA
jgi:hypothetical protein